MEPADTELRLDDPLIRHAHGGDWPVIAEIQKRSIPKNNEWHDKDIELLDRIRYEHWTLTATNRSLHPIGFLVFYRTFLRMEIHAVAVHPDYWRMGVGLAMVKDVQRRVRMYGSGNTLFARVDPENKPLVELFERAEFDLVEVVDNGCTWVYRWGNE